MKLLKRNLTKFEYLPYDGVMTDVNDDGYHTGEFRRKYEEPVQMEGNISAPSGKVNETFYGEDIRYTHTLVMDNPEAGIHEGGLICWKGDLYDIVSVHPSLNVLSVALRKQTVDHAESDD